MAGFVPVAKTFGEALKYSTIDLSKNVTPVQAIVSIAGGVAGATIMHNDEHPVLSTVGGYALGNNLVVAGIIASNAMKYLK